MLNDAGHAISATTLNQSGGSHLRLNHPGDVLGNLLISGSSKLTVGAAAGQTTGLTVTGPMFSSMVISLDSSLTLELNNLAGGWILAWANPAGGDHIADLQGLISSGQISFSYLNTSTYALSADSQNTYVLETGVPEPSTLVLAAAATGVLAAVTRKRRARPREYAE